MVSLNLFFNQLFQIITKISINDVVDMMIIAYIFYKILMFIKDTRAEQLFKGVVILLVATQLSGIFKLHTLYWILVKILEVGFILPFIIFQPELRAGLEHIGRNTSIRKLGPQAASKYDMDLIESIESLLDAVYDMADKKIGALVVIEGKTKLNEITETGTKINGEITKQLICNIFVPNTPLHDGAVIVRDLKVLSAACFLPLTQRKDLSKDLGTRHRAGIGISEISDCLTIIVSEESGKVSIARSGKIYRNIAKERLFNILREFEEKRHENNFGFIKDFIKKN
ncbi:MAG: diadenylate cyclase CdaA [Peptostreptococcus porci]|uniref:diadenylate cyclase CdaA n=1 Tax=Peptostreptococcus porci TaxID=2652282 RepID=UPI002A75DF4D|nr:diadenylate cyclase CdaA [Peptostreptococcus porci]MDY2795539.1 diadenylate cyclase CdaA [Peptostreptococcus porci]MDY5480633.1 diadenylate cyclase CdaA [Peptostreptococcus porci]MDY5739740.1 diadenylate cyclase CdaA [Anaerovoracaceae bacterium]